MNRLHANIIPFSPIDFINDNQLIILLKTFCNSCIRMYLCSRQVVLGINVEYTGDGKVWFGFVSLQLSGNHRPYMDMGNDGRSEPIFFYICKMKPKSMML